MTAPRKVVCVNNQGLEASLTKGKTYTVTPNAEAEVRGFLHIVDDTGEDSLFYSEHFIDAQVTLGDGLELDISTEEQCRRIIEVAYLYVLRHGYRGTAAMIAAAQGCLEVETAMAADRREHFANQMDDAVEVFRAALRSKGYG